MNGLGQQTNTLPADVIARIVGGSQGHEDEIMAYARQHLNDQVLWWPGSADDGTGGNDCHTAILQVLSHFPYLTIPADLRWNPGDKAKIKAQWSSAYVESVNGIMELDAVGF
jgi:hypothetical protein